MRQDQLTEMLRLGASAEIAETWNALGRYIAEQTPEHFEALRDAYRAAEATHGDNQRALEDYMQDDSPRDTRKIRADGLGGRQG